EGGRDGSRARRDGRRLMEAHAVAPPARRPRELPPAELRRLSYLSLFWLAARECLRVGRLWSQTVLAPVVSSLLFVIVFGLSLGGGRTAVGAPLLGVPIEHPFALVAAALAAIMLFASLGVIVGIYAQSWDHHSFVSNLVIQPLAFVGGVFYSVDILPSPWHEL